MPEDTDVLASELAKQLGYRNPTKLAFKNGVLSYCVQGKQGDHRQAILKFPHPGTSPERELWNLFYSAFRWVHQNPYRSLVQVEHVSKHQGLPVVIMQLLPGDSLAQSLAKSPSTSAQPTDLILLQAAELLDYVHRHGAVLQNFSPFVCLWQNHSLTLRRPDFLRPSSVELSGGNLRFWGRIEYLAPEHLYYCHKSTEAMIDFPPMRGFPNHIANHASDVFAWGVFAAAMLSGNLDPCRRRQSEQHYQIAEHPLNIEGPYQSIIRKATQFFPAARYQNGTELLQELKASTSI